MIIAALGLSLSCGRTSQAVDKTYNGLFVETFWTIDLNDNGGFKLLFLGHYSHDSLFGNYTFKGDTLELTPDFIDERHIQNVDLKFVLVDNHCLVGLTTANDYCDNRTDDWCSRSWDLKAMKVERDCEY